MSKPTLGSNTFKCICGNEHEHVADTVQNLRENKFLLTINNEICMQIDKKTRIVCEHCDTKENLFWSTKTTASNQCEHVWFLCENCLKEDEWIRPSWTKEVLGHHIDTVVIRNSDKKVV